MKRRTIGVVLALVAAAAVPLGLPHSAAAAGFTSVVFSPLPIAQPGSLLASATVDLCVQPESAPGVHVAGTVYLNILAGEFTAPPNAGGTAMVGTTALTSTPAPFATSATCTLPSGPSFPNSILVAYTSAVSLPINGRDVISGADAPADNATAASGGNCPASVPCGTAAYVYSPVTTYVFSPSPIATTGALTAGQVVNVTVTAEDSTGRAISGAYLDLSLTSTGATGGSAVAFSEISKTNKQLTNIPQRIGSLSCSTAGCGAGTVAITYTAANPLPASGVDTITAQNHPTATVTVTDTYTYSGTTPPPVANPYTAITPFRVCDTRPTSQGITANQCDNAANPAGFGPIGTTPRVVTIQGFGSPAVPAGATAVVVNVTAIAPTKKTFVTLYPDGSGNPGTSNLNVLAGHVVANLVEVGLSTAGKIDVFNPVGSINVAIDIEGYVSSASTALYNSLAAPVRICDTRAPGGAVISTQCNASGANPILASSPLTFNVHTGTDGIPSSGVIAVVFNLTAILPSQPTVLTAYPSDVSRPLASNINLNPGTAVPNRIIVPVSSTGTIGDVSIWNGVGSVNVAVDIGGWFQVSSGKKFTPLARPFRVCNTQNGNPSDGGETTGCVKATVSGGSVLNIDVTGLDGIPQAGTAGAPFAIVANVTAVNATKATFVTVYPGPDTSPVPNASDINVASLQPVPNLVVVGVDQSDGTINLYNALGNVNLIVDIYGYYS
jgi:hypothetical protein